MKERISYVTYSTGKLKSHLLLRDIGSRVHPSSFFQQLFVHVRHERQLLNFVSFAVSLYKRTKNLFVLMKRAERYRGTLAEKQAPPATEEMGVLFC